MNLRRRYSRRPNHLAPFVWARRTTRPPNRQAKLSKHNGDNRHGLFCSPVYQSMVVRMAAGQRHAGAMWAQDEMRVGQKTARSGSIADQRSEAAYLCGALGPEHDDTAALVMRRSN